MSVDSAALAPRRTAALTSSSVIRPPGPLPLTAARSTASSRASRRVAGPAALPETGYAAKVVLTQLPAGQDVFYRVTFQDLGDLASTSVPVSGRLKTAATDERDLTFAWSADTAGQGWGINPEWGGMKMYDTLRALQPDFFVHSGDMIYADGPLAATVAAAGVAGFILWRLSRTVRVRPAGPPHP